jgi:hypothetical protein
MSSMLSLFGKLPDRKCRFVAAAIGQQVLGVGMPNLFSRNQFLRRNRFRLTREYYIQDHTPVLKPSSQPAAGSDDDLSPHDASRISRRDFGRHAAVVAALAFSPGALVGSPQNSGRERNPEAKLPVNRGDSLTLEQSQEVEAKLANIIRKYGNRLADDQRAHLRRILTYNEKMLASVRSFPIQNGDPPASVLKVSFLEERTSSGLHAAAPGEATLNQKNVI